MSGLPVCVGPSAIPALRLASRQSVPARSNSRHALGRSSWCRQSLVVVSNHTHADPEIGNPSARLARSAA